MFKKEKMKRASTKNGGQSGGTNVGVKRHDHSPEHERREITEDPFNSVVGFDTDGVARQDTVPGGQ